MNAPGPARPHSCGACEACEGGEGGEGGEGADQRHIEETTAKRARERRRQGMLAVRANERRALLTWAPMLVTLPP